LLLSVLQPHRIEVTMKSKSANLLFIMAFISNNC
jgi:hypothetical protein